MEDKASTLEKIKKCLALAGSSNEHEAAAALRSAQALMAKHGVTDSEVLACSVNEHTAKASVKRKPARWESNLAALVGAAFGCEVLLSSCGYVPAQWCFIGYDSAAAVAGYAFEVLLRQIKRARQEFIASNQLRGLASKSKTVRADIYCAGWINSISKTVSVFARPAEQDAAIAAYMTKRCPDELDELKSIDRISGKNISVSDALAWKQGQSDGADVRLHRGMDSACDQLRLCGE